MRYLRHKTNAQNILQQSTQARGQRGKIKEDLSIFRCGTKNWANIDIFIILNRFIAVHMYQKVVPATWIKHLLEYAKR